MSLNLIIWSQFFNEQNILSVKSEINLEINSNTYTSHSI